MNTMLDDIFMTMSTSTGLYPKLDLWTANKLQLQLHKYDSTQCLYHTLERTNKIEILSRKCACHTLFFVANVTIVRCCNFFF